MRPSLTAVLGVACCVAAGSCTNRPTPRDFQRSGPVAEGHRPRGLYGEAAPVVPPRGAGDAAVGSGTVEGRVDVLPPEGAAALAGEPRSLPAFAGESGAPIGWGELLSRAAQSDVVILGETHGDAAGQRFLEEFWKDLLTQAPAAWLSLEFFERDQQTAIDDYLAGVTNEVEFRASTRRSSDNFPAGHRAMLEEARRLGRPVIASNAPRRYARLARTAGFDRLWSLGPDQQKSFVVPGALTEGRYREEFEREMRPGLEAGAHAASERADAADAARAGDVSASAPEPSDTNAKLEGYYRAQNLWDATMADSLARPVLAGARPVVHVVGRFHSDFGGGLVERLRAAAPGVRILTVSMVAEAPAGGNTMLAPDVGRADVVVYLKP
ncbi:MAG: ChaN family lipoprotein [Planctomycetota bacterium]|nr:ChaN family lipoprotein [Planctomycetota bacterium]